MATIERESCKLPNVQNGCCVPGNQCESGGITTTDIQGRHCLYEPYRDTQTTDMHTLSVASVKTSNSEHSLHGCIHGVPRAMEREAPSKHEHEPTLTENSLRFTVNAFTAVDIGSSRTTTTTTAATPQHITMASPGSRGCRRTHCCGARTDTAIELVRKQKYDRSFRCLLPLFICAAIVNPFVLPVILVYYIRSLCHWKHGHVTRALWYLNRATIGALIGMLLSTCVGVVSVSIYLSTRNAGNNNSSTIETVLRHNDHNNTTTEFELHTRPVPSSVPNSEVPGTNVITLPPSGHWDIISPKTATFVDFFASVNVASEYSYKTIFKNDTYMKIYSPNTGKYKEITLPFD